MMVSLGVPLALCVCQLAGLHVFVQKVTNHGEEPWESERENRVCLVQLTKKKWAEQT